MYYLSKIYDALDKSAIKLDTFTDLKNYKNHPFLKNAIEDMKSYAETTMDLDSINTSYRTFKLFKITGDRTGYQKPYYERRKRLMTFSLLLYLFPDNERYLHQLEEITWQICNEYTWCLPAHLGGSPNHLDLFACETGFAMAEMLCLNGHQLTEELATIVKQEVQRRIFTPFMDKAYVHKFEAMTNNWSAVCGGAIGATAIYLIDDQYELANILNRVLSSIDIYLDSFGDDGICTEGINYWTYGFGFFVCFADLLAKKTNGNIDLFQLDKVESIAKSQQCFYIFRDKTISFADGVQRSNYRLGLSTYLQKRYPDIALPDLEFASPIYYDTCYRFCLGLRDLFWVSKDASHGLPSHNSTYLEDCQWLISKGPKTALVTKGGHNNEPHNHNDIGSFTYFLEDCQVLCDLGAGLYDAKYFSPARYTIFCNSSLSHNVPTINGQPQIEGSESISHDLAYHIGDHKDSFSLNLEKCYDVDSLDSYHRKLSHDKENGTLEISDTFICNQTSTIEQRFITLYATKIHGDQVTILSPNGEVSIQPTLTPVKVHMEPTPHATHKDANEIVNVIVFTFNCHTDHPSGGCTLTTDFTIQHR